jgi:hypothetical protein
MFDQPKGFPVMLATYIGEPELFEDFILGPRLGQIVHILPQVDAVSAVDEVVQV